MASPRGPLRAAPVRIQAQPLAGDSRWGLYSPMDPARTARPGMAGHVGSNMRAHRPAVEGVSLFRLGAEPTSALADRGHIASEPRGRGTAREKRWFYERLRTPGLVYCVLRLDDRHVVRLRERNEISFQPRPVAAGSTRAVVMRDASRRATSPARQSGPSAGARDAAVDRASARRPPCTPADGRTERARDSARPRAHGGDSAFRGPRRQPCVARAGRRRRALRRCAVCLARAAVEDAA